MIEDILKDKKFIDMMKAHVNDCLKYLLNKETNFSIMANLDFVIFDPILPKEISDGFKMPAIVFELGGYTLQSAFLDAKNEIFGFEAGFGENNFASIVKIPFHSIVQIFIEENPILINFSIKEKKDNEKKKIFSIAD